jgi:hypothetical protein
VLFGFCSVSQGHSPSRFPPSVFNPVIPHHPVTVLVSSLRKGNSAPLNSESIPIKAGPMLGRHQWPVDQRSVARQITFFRVQHYLHFHCCEKVIWRLRNVGEIPLPYCAFPQVRKSNCWEAHVCLARSVVPQVEIPNYGRPVARSTQTIQRVLLHGPIYDFKVPEVIGSLLHCTLRIPRLRRG